MYIPATARGNGLVKPAGELRLNRNHPAAYGLKHLFMCDGTGMTDLVTGKRYKATGGSQAVDAFGVGWKSGGAGTCIVGPTGAEANKTGNADNGVSVIVSGKFSNSTSTAAIANSYYADYGGWVFKAAQYSSTNQVGFGSFGVGADYASGIATPTAEGSVISVRAVAGTTQYRVKNSTSSTANATPSNVGDYISIGAGFKFNSATPIDTLNSGDIVYWAAIFDETISAAQADAWHRGPFGSIVTRVLPSVSLLEDAGAAVPTTTIVTGNAVAAVGIPEPYLYKLDADPGASTVNVTPTAPVAGSFSVSPIALTTSNWNTGVSSSLTASAAGSGNISSTNDGGLANDTLAVTVHPVSRPSAVTPNTWTDEAGGTLVVADINDASDSTGAMDPAGASYPVLAFTMDTPMAASVAQTCYFRGNDVAAGKQVRQVLFANDGTTVVATGAWKTMTGSLATYSDVLTPTATAYKGEIQTQSA